MRNVKWLGQTIDNACMQACNVQYGATSAKPDAAALIACFVTQCSGSQTAPRTVIPSPGFTLPAGTVLPGGFTIPAGWTLPQGFPLPAGPASNLPGQTFPPGWSIPGGVVPPGFTLPIPWTIPVSWQLPILLTLPTALTVPPGVPVPPNLPTVPPPPQTGTPPSTTPPATTEKKSDNTMLWVVGGLAAVAVVAVVASSSNNIGGGMLAANPKGNEPWQYRTSGMGRRDSRPDEFVGPAQLQRVPLNGDYDPGGAYWGGGRGTLPLYAAWDEDGNAIFVRAHSRAQAKSTLEAKGIRFKRG